MELTGGRWRSGTHLGREGAGVGRTEADDALVVVGEFVTNALRHAATDFTVAVSVEPGRLRLEVTVGDARSPASDARYAMAPAL